MGKITLKKVEQQTNNSHLNMFVATYALEDGREIGYQIASRAKIVEELVISKKQAALTPDAVRILPYFYRDGEQYVLLIKEFRYPVNDYIYAVPAGLTDKGEDVLTAAARELLEETGRAALSLTVTDKASYTSAGMSDESIVCLEAEVAPTAAPPRLDQNERIETQEIKTKDLLAFLQRTPNVGLQSRLQLKAFYYKSVGMGRGELVNTNK